MAGQSRFPHRSPTSLTREEQSQRTQEAHRLLTDAVEQLATSDDWLKMLALSERLPTYSPRNCVMLAAQDARGMVMGYRAWQSIPAIGGGFCQVRRGAKGLKILAPVTRSRPEVDEVSAAQTPLSRVVGFTAISVFDETALTSAPAVPQRPQRLGENAPVHLWDALAAQVTASGYCLDTSAHVTATIFPANGLTDHQIRTVAVRPDLSPGQRAKTLAHELAHVRLHHPDVIPEGTTRSTAEVEAESVAFLVAAELNLDSSAYSIPYIAGWAKGNTELILATADRAVRTARDISDAVQTYLREPSLQTAIPDEPRHSLPPASPSLTNDSESERMHRLYDAPASAMSAMGAELDPVTISTTSGAWHLTWRPEQSTFTAHHLTTPGPFPMTGVHECGHVSRVIGALPQEITSMGALEQHLGFALPHRVRDYLDAARAMRPAALTAARDFSTLYPGDRDNPTELPATERPTRTSVVTVPAAGATISMSYGTAMGEVAPTRRWSSGAVSVEILSGEANLDPELRRHQALTYRLTENNRVIFSGDDIIAPLDIDPASDTAVQQVVLLLCVPEDGISLSTVQTEFVTRSALDLLRQTQLPEPPYAPGTRVAVTPPGDGTTPVTGTVVEAIRNRDDVVGSYSWRPDTAALTGHPWHDNPRHTIVSSAANVQATLAEPDVGLTGWNPDVPLAFGTHVSVPTGDVEAQPGVVIRAFARNSHWEYDVRPSAPPPGPSVSAGDAPAEFTRVGAGDLIPAVGTAWDSTDALLRARGRSGITPHDGEILAVRGHLAQVVVGDAGVELAERELLDLVAVGPSTWLATTAEPIAVEPTADRSVTPCATPDCYDEAASTVSVGRPNLPTELSQRCGPCAARAILTALPRGYTVDIRPLHSPTVMDPPTPAVDTTTAVFVGAGGHL